MADDSSVVNHGDDALGVVALGTFKWVDFINVLDEPGSVGFGVAVQWSFIKMQGGGGVDILLVVSLPSCPITVPAVIVHEMFVLVGYDRRCR